VRAELPERDSRSYWNSEKTATTQRSTRITTEAVFTHSGAAFARRRRRRAKAWTPTLSNMIGMRNNIGWWIWKPFVTIRISG